MFLEKHCTDECRWKLISPGFGKKVSHADYSASFRFLQLPSADMNIAFHFLNLKKLPGPFFDKKLIFDLARNDTFWLTHSALHLT